jgi:hypothetical protein
LLYIIRKEHPTTPATPEPDTFRASPDSPTGKQRDFLKIFA